MSFRTRILLACLIVAVVPLAVFALGARRAVHERLTAQFEARVAAASDVIADDLARHAVVLGARLHGLAERIDQDPRQRVALLQLGERAALLDYAADVMPAAGLDYLLLLDSTGNVLSSGHFRNEYDRALPALPSLLATRAPVLVTARRPQGGFLALVRAHAFSVGDRSFALVGGIEADSSFMRRLGRADAVAVSLEHGDDVLSSNLGGGVEVSDDRAVRKEIALPFIDDARGMAEPGEARWIIAHSLAPLHAIQRGMDIWFMAALTGAIVLALLIARALAARVNRPLEELAARTTKVNLDRLDVGFALQRQDEIGALSRLLDTMVGRLRKSASQLRIAERRATVGDMARQVNHDIRNGLLPIRNVVRHLKEVARDEPDQLANIFSERAGTLEGGVNYLENLASNYARLSPRAERHICDVNAIIRTVLADTAIGERAQLQLELSDAAPRIAADPVALRRIIENLAINAIESLQNGKGRITISTHVESKDRERHVTITVTDTGSGIEAGALDHIFNDFYTTRERGTGLGLSIVRRLVTDMGGRIRVQSSPGKGTTFRIDVPEAR